MNTSKKIALGLGVAGGALLAAWLLTGDRKKKTKEFVSKAANDIKNAFNSEDKKKDDSDVHYV
ncbi:MAG: hypothetical protein ING84_17005 [Cytophagales bacterium]|jgi:hypothetical protein|nr:hypothetical protein [Cytophagales bacterium]MCA6366728.1 hypothetical protein [Cytophagales bacterium]MCA6372741.1 hypothetical protein [Cytophagales bacterium]MCA6377597.1 hypothetical protein [Cytophagales bacterium]MCA6384764.1 hypothetical protein [Cytophagales bacterium]